MSRQTFIHVNGKLVEKSEAIKSHSVNIMKDIVLLDLPGLENLSILTHPLFK